jgi:hypothetical protein
MRHCCCGAHAESLACKRTFAEEAPITQYADSCFPASFGDNGESYFARLQVKNRVCGIPLREDGVLLRKEHSFPTLADRGEECMGVELAAVLGSSTWTRGIPRSLGYPINRPWAGDFR